MGQLGWTQPEPKGLQIGGFWPTDPDPDAGLGGKGGRQTDGASNIIPVALTTLGIANLFEMLL